MEVEAHDDIDLNEKLWQIIKKKCVKKSVKGVKPCRSQHV